MSSVELETLPFWNSLACAASISYQSTFDPRPPETACAVHNAHGDGPPIRGSKAILASSIRPSSVSMVYSGVGGSRRWTAGAGGEYAGTVTHWAGPITGPPVIASFDTLMMST